GGAHFLYDLSQTDVLAQVVGTDPAAVQPQHVDLAVVGAQLPDLLVGKADILLPQFWLLVNVVVDIAGGSGAELGRPIVGAVPVRFGKVGGDGQPLAAEFPVQRAHNVGIGIGVEGTVGGGDLVIGGFGIVHAEPVMVLG